MRPARILLLVVLVCARPAPTEAWERASEVVHGSARVLEKGETMVGILSPLAFGVHERITVFTHPALLLLLTPSFWGRLAVLEGGSAVALESGYQQSWLALATSEGEGPSPGTPGYLQLGTVFSQLVTNDLQLNVAGGYLAEFGRSGKEDRFSGFYWRVGANWVLKEVNLLLLEVRGKALSGEGHDVPSGSLIFARQLGRPRLGIGACFGRFTPELLGGLVDEPVYVYPWADVWWRF